MIPRADACAATRALDGRACESLVGDVVTDAMRTTYSSTDFAITNSGGLRADLTCPTGATSNAATSARRASTRSPNARPFPITRGQVLGVLPFGNMSATMTINGAELKDELENGVSRCRPTGNGRFGQVSGLCFTYDIEGAPATFARQRDHESRAREAGSSSAVRQAADGSCTGAPVSFSAGVNYTLTTNDFTAGGGDGYPNIRSRMTTQDILDQDLADYLAASPGGVVSPVIQHRIHCTDSEPGGGADACPTGSP